MTATKEHKVMHYHFKELAAYRKLEQLAQTPYDLTAPGSLSVDRIDNYCAHAAGYKLVYATERVTNETIDALKQLADETQAIEKMKRMQSGEVVNFVDGFPSEDRPALHTAVRDFFDDKQEGAAASEARDLAFVEVEKLKQFIAQIDKENKFNEIIIIAIGGSELGPHANYLALEALKRNNRRAHFISNVDPDNAAAVLQAADLSRTLVLVVSKSGSTLETRTNEEFVRSYFTKAGLDPKEHFVAITGKGSPMDDKSKYLESFYIWNWIGGRYSASSMVGGVLMAFVFGFDVYWEFLKGAHDMDRAALKNDLNSNLPLLGALLSVWNHNFLGYPTLAIIPYAQPLARYPAHIQQVEMESNGKHIDQNGHVVDFQTGPIIWGEPGTNAQHSFFQLIHQGTAVVPVEYVGFTQSQRGEDYQLENTYSHEKLLSNLLAQALALATGKKSDNPNRAFVGNRPSHLLIADKLTPHALGALLAYFEHKVAFEGFIWNINSFDQEGVQLGKELAGKLIARFAAARQGTEGSPYPEGDAFLRHFKT